MIGINFNHFENGNKRKIKVSLKSFLIVSSRIPIEIASSFIFNFDPTLASYLDFLGQLVTFCIIAVFKMVEIDADHVTQKKFFRSSYFKFKFFIVLHNFFF